MTVEEYLSQNQELIRQECQAIEDSNLNAIITIKENGSSYIHQVSSVEKFIQTIPNNRFFKTMRDGVNNAVLNKVIPVVIFEQQRAKIISLPTDFQPGE
ncbi:MAG: hypothetical protein AAFW67_06015 [Cyanobacteria bacterium J06638_38]